MASLFENLNLRVSILIEYVTAFNKVEDQLFYRLLGDLMDKYKFTPNNIYNCDETGISTVQDPGKILAPKGMKKYTKY